MSDRTVLASRGDAGERLDLVVRRRLADDTRATRTRVQDWIRSGAVQVNGQAIRRPAARAALGDVIVVSVPEMRPRAPVLAEAAPLDVLFEDEHFLAVNKPPGLVVHPTFRHPTGTLMNALLWRARTWPDGQRPSLVGRLDRWTSGLVLVAKSRRFHASMQRTLAASVSEKVYLAIVYGRIAAARGSIELGLRRDPIDRRRVVAVSEGGVTSLTHFERLARVAAPRVGLTLLRCQLGTGRMHQIRVHLAARGWPIVGDQVYGAPHWNRITDDGLARALREFPRQALHAWRVAFPHPASGRAVHIEAAPPHDFLTLLRDVSLSCQPLNL